MMKILDTLDRFCVLTEIGFADWGLPGADPELFSQPDWPAVGTALCSLTGRLEDLADDADALVELLREGWSLCDMGVVTQAQLAAEVESVLRAGLPEAIETQKHFDHISENN